MKTTHTSRAKAVCKGHKNAVSMQTKNAPRSRLSRSFETWRAWQLADGALNASRIAAPLSRERWTLARTIDRLREGMQRGDLASVERAVEEAERNPLAHADAHFPASVAWARFLRRVAPEQIALPFAPATS